MENSQVTGTSLDIRKTKFTLLKEEQCTLNMQIRLAMQLHDARSQTDLEEKLKDVTEQIRHII